MKRKLLLLFVCITATIMSRAQGSSYDFSALNADGIMLYYKITDEPNKEVRLAQNNTNDAYNTVTKLVIPDKVRNPSNVEYTVTDIGPVLKWSTTLIMEELVLPSTMKYFNTWQPFLGVKKVKKLIVPAGVIAVNGIIFQGLDDLKELYLLPENPPENISVHKQVGIFNMQFSSTKIFTPTDRSYFYKTDVEWKRGSNGLIVPYSEQITLNANGYASLYLENENFEVPAGCTAYIIKGSKQGAGNYPDADIVAFGAGKILPKQTAFILQGAANATIQYFAHVSGTEVDVSGNLLVGTATGEEFSGVGYKYYIFSDGSLGQGFYHQGTRKGQSIKVKAHRAGLRLPVTGHGFAPAKELIFDFEAAKEQLATGIRQLPHVAPASKEDVIFDLQGRRVLHPTRGIYIINGKKVVME